MALVQTAQEGQLGAGQRGGEFAQWVARHAPILLLGLFMLLFPAIASDFFLRQIAGWTMILGIIALSLMFLAGYGGMVSLAQMTVAGVAGYMIAVLGVSSLPKVSLFLPWWVAAPLAIVIAVAFGTLAGALSARTEGIYTIMITLAIATSFFYLTLQNWPIFNGFSGFTTIPAPHCFRRQLEAPAAAVLHDPVFRGAELRRCHVHFASAIRARACKACAIIRAAWRRSDTMSPPTALPPMPSRLSSLQSAEF